MNRIAVCLLALACLAAAPAQAASCRLGTVTQSAGDASVLRDGKSTPVQVGDGICEQDRYVTAANGVVALRFRDGTQLTVGKSTEFVIAKWRERRFRANEATFDLVKGAFRTITGAITKRAHRMEIRSPIATIGVRGTDFWGGIDLTPGGLDVVMLEGKGVYVVNDAGRVELTTAGSGTTVMPGAAPGEARTWPAEKVARAVQTITP